MKMKSKKSDEIVQEQLLTAFSGAAKEETPLFAVVLSDGQLKVWDTANSDVVGSLQANLSDPITAIAWERWDISVGDKHKKKRAKKASQPTTANARLVIGTSGGKVLIYSHQSGATIELKGKHAGRVNAVTWGKDSNTVFSCSEDRHVFMWSIETSSISKKFKGSTEEPMTALTYCGNLKPTGTEVIAYGSSQISIVAVDSGEVVKTVVGHANSIGAVRVLSDSLLSAAYGEPDDTLMYTWATNQSDSGKKAQSTFGVGSAIVAVDVAQVGSEWRILAVTSDGLVEVFEFDPTTKSKKKKPIKAIGSLQFTTGDVPSVTVPIISAAFAKNRPGTHIVTARGNGVVPVLEELLYVDEDGETPLKCSLVRDNLTSANLLTAQSGGSVSDALQKSTSAERAAATIVGGSSVVSQSRVASEPTLAEQAEEIGLVPSSVAISGTPTAGSVVHMLAQALHSNDKALLEQCLANTNEGVVRSTVSRLSAPLAVKFLTVVVGKLQARPNRGTMLMVWIRAILLVHTSYLMTVPDLPKILEGMYNLVDARLAVFPRLLKLSGRLDLLLSQVLLKSEGVADDKDEESIKVPVVSYDDEDSNDSGDDDEGAMDDDALIDSGESGDEWGLPDDDDDDDDEDEGSGESDDNE